MRIKDLSQDELDDISDAAATAAARLPHPDHASPRAALEHLDAYIVKWLNESRQRDAADELEQTVFELGALWGQLLASSLNWQWIRVEFTPQGLEAIGVSPADHSLVIYPFQTVFLYHERQLAVRILRSFEILTEPGRVPMLPPGGLENVMDHVH